MVLAQHEPCTVGLSEWAHSARARVEAALVERLAGLGGVDHRLRDAMAHGLLGGGKRIRALLVLASAQACDLAEALLLPAACALEAVHAYSLIHDDMPCMDDDELRRGKPTVHVQYGEAMALLAGDALQTAAFEWLSDSALEDAAKVRQIRYFAQSAGVAGMAGGQAIDLNHVGMAMGLDELKRMHACKTGALIRASVMMPAVAVADEALTNRLETYANAIGLAFQVVDDILDVENDSLTLGKTAGKDADNNKPTMVSLLGLSEAKALAHSLAVEAEEALEGLGERAALLRALIEQVVTRQS